MSKITEIGKWTDKKLVSELRSRLREEIETNRDGTMNSPYTLLFAEALARLLERKP